MSDLAKSLEIKAGVMEMGEQIAWGSDTALMRKAAEAIRNYRARVAELQAEHEKLVKSINRAGGLTSQGASHELIREILSEALEGK